MISYPFLLYSLLHKIRGIYILNYTKINREKSSMNHGLLLV